VPVLLGVLIGLAALLAIPIGFAFRLERVEALAGELAIRWLFGLVRFRVRIPGARRERAKEPDAGRKPARERPRRRRRTGPAEIVAVLRDAAFRDRVQRLARDLLRAAHVTGLRLRMRLGLGDPADTGLLWAFLGPLGALAGGLRGADVRLEPEFLDEVLEMHAEGRTWFVPLQLLALALSFALSPASVRAWRTLRGRRA
jgi:hypothetical protein